MGFFIGNFIYAFSFQGWILYPAAIISGTGAMVQPILQSLTLRGVQLSKQGIFLGVVGSTKVASQMIGALIVSNVFAFFISEDAPFYFPGASYLFASMLYLFVTIFSLLVFRFFSNKAALE